MKLLWITVSVLLVIGCTPDESLQNLDADIAKLELKQLPEVVHPANNPTSTEKIALGKALFWDPIIAGEKDIACATCHHPEFAYGDGLDLPIGVRGTGLGPDRVEGTGIIRVPRNSQTVINTAFNGITKESQSYNADSSIMFWDGREQSLEEQSRKPPTARHEMLGDFGGGPYALEYILPRLAEYPEYVDLFAKAFPDDANPINIANYGKAIGAFERTIIAKNSAYDKYLGGDMDALTTSQKKGLLLFYGNAKCSECHSGPMLSDWSLHALGGKEHPVKEAQGGPDKGDERYYDYKFRTPTLRNITLTGPYNHNGMYETLEDIMDFYIAGKSENSYVTEVSELFVPIAISKEESRFIIDFMRALEDNDFDKSIPETVPSGLNPGGNID